MPPTPPGLLSACPRWIAIPVAVASAAAALWIIFKLIKWTLWLLLAALLAGIVILGAWLILG